MAIKFGNKIIIYTKIYYYNKFGPLDSTNGSQITSVPRGWWRGEGSCANLVGVGSDLGWSWCGVARD